MKRNRVIAVAVVGSTIVVGAVVGSLAGIALSATPQIASAETSESSAIVDSYATNATGLTFGEFGVGLKSDPGAHPDLILVVATNGVEGYAYYDAVFGPTATSLDEAKRQSNVDLKETVVPVYLEDGKTQVGEYVANGGSR
jgi:hypothetical protein